MSRIEEYALIGDCRSAGLVARNGSLDWLCLPRFDSDACFAGILGTHDNGFWKIAPILPLTAVQRRYREGTLTLETRHTCAEGTILITDVMPVGPTAMKNTPSVVRVVSGVEGEVRVRSEIALRFNYGKTVPWVQRATGESGGGIQAVAGPDLVRLWTTAPLVGENLRTTSDMVIRPGDRVPFVLRWAPSWTPEASSPIDPERALAESDAHWQQWSQCCNTEGPYAHIVRRSLLTLKALTFQPTGGIVAAPTTSLPECIGTTRNWDYRYCWLRDAAFTLYALMSVGFRDEALAWRDWLLRAAAGAPEQLQIMYGVAGERRLEELELPWLAGYENSRPVRIGNGAAEQLQLDVYGELAGTLYLARNMGLDGAAGWALERALLRHLEKAWREPDHGIWEVRGPRRHFVHSKVMCWLAFDRGVKSIERWGLSGPLDRWRALRDEIHADICTSGIDRATGAFVQCYGSTEPDASLLLLPMVGFLPPDDPRIVSTVLSIEKRLLINGFIQRYVTKAHVDGLPEGEGAFLACSFWFVDALALIGRRDDARAHFERLLGLLNDVGLLAEEYDPVTRRMLGNFPQALSHVALINSAHNLSREEGPSLQRHSM